MSTTTATTPEAATVGERPESLRGLNPFAVLGAGVEIAGRRDPHLIRGIVLIGLAQIFAVIPFVLLAIALRDLLDGSATLAQLLWIAAGMAGCMLVRWLLSAVSLLEAWTGIQGLLSDGRLRMIEHLRRLPMGYYTTARTGELNQAVTGDLHVVSSIFGHGLYDLVHHLAMVVLMLGVLLVVDWRLGLLSLLMLPLAFVALAWSQRVFAANSLQQTKLAGDVSARVVEYIDGIRVLRSFQMTGPRMRTLDTALRDYEAAQLRNELGLTPLLVLYAFVVELGFALVVTAGVLLLDGGDLSTTTFLTFVVLAVGVFHPLSEIATGMAVLRFSMTSLTRIRNILALPTQTAPTRSVTLTAYDLAFEQVTFAYEERIVLHDVSFAVPQGTTTALVGVSGSGKSTLANLLMRLWDVNAGTVRVGGVDVRDLAFDDLNASIGSVFQEVYLFRDSIAANIRIGRPDASMDEVIAAAKRARAHDFIVALPQGYDTVIGEGGSTISGGEKQRISIARALLKDAPILILDEATASVDLDNERQIQEALSELRGQRTTLVIAHRLWTIRHADQIVVMDRGRVLESGTHSELLALGGRYAEMWAQQQRARGWRLNAGPGAAVAGTEAVAASPARG